MTAETALVTLPAWLALAEQLREDARDRAIAAAIDAATEVK